MKKCDLIKNLEFTKETETREVLINDQDKESDGSSEEDNGSMPHLMPRQEDNKSIPSLILQELDSRDEYSLDNSQDSNKESMPGLILCDMESNDDTVVVKIASQGSP